MTTEVITLTSACPGGNHLVFTLSGARALTVRMELDDLLVPVTDDDVTVLCRLVVRMARAGRTVAQARTLLLAGVTITV